MLGSREYKQIGMLTLGQEMGEGNYANLVTRVYACPDCGCAEEHVAAVPAAVIDGPMPVIDRESDTP